MQMLIVSHSWSCTLLFNVKITCSYIVVYNRAAVVGVLVVVVVVVVVVVAVVYNSFPARNFSLEFPDKLSQCMIAYKILTEYFWKFQWKLHPGNVVSMPYWTPRSIMHCVIVAVPVVCTGGIGTSTRSSWINCGSCSQWCAKVSNLNLNSISIKECILSPQIPDWVELVV